MRLDHGATPPPGKPSLVTVATIATGTCAPTEPLRRIAACLVPTIPSRSAAPICRLVWEWQPAYDKTNARLAVDRLDPLIAGVIEELSDRKVYDVSRPRPAVTATAAAPYR
jgi:hypothetical protein